MNLKNFLKLPTYQALNTIEISKKNLLFNLRYLSNLQSRIKISPIIKSNGYGHGILEIAKILEVKNPLFLCVDSLYEAYQLLNSDIQTPLLIMGYIDPENLKVKKLPFSYSVCDLKLLQAINDFQPEAGVHLFIDTGMNREGIPLDLLPTYLKQLTRLPNIKIEGIMSHLSSADNKKDPLNREQIKNFKQAVKIVSEFGHKPKYLHLQNSDGLLNVHLRGDNLNMARVGLALYGISNAQTRSGSSKLKPVLTLKSKIIQIKHLKRGDKVGYGGTFTAKKKMTLGVLPLGYFDGVDRRLSNTGFVMVNGKACKIIGRVSMNITTIDLTDLDNPIIGQDVIVYSNNPKDLNSIENAAKLCKTIPWELLVHLDPSIKRVVLD